MLVLINIDVSNSYLSSTKLFINVLTLIKTLFIATIFSFSVRPSMGAKKLKTNDIQIPAKSSTKSEVNHTSKSKMGTEATNMYLQRKSFLPVSIFLLL